MNFHGVMSWSIELGNAKSHAMNDVQDVFESMARRMTFQVPETAIAAMSVSDAKRQAGLLRPAAPAQHPHIHNNNYLRGVS